MSFNSPFTGNVVQPTDVSYRAITLSSNTTLSWPINGNATDNYAARIMDVTATSAGLKLAMPPANQTSVGNDAMIRNVGAYSFEVTDYAGSTVSVVAASAAKYIYITTNATAAGTWGQLSFGSGSSAVDAAALAGYGLTAIGALLNTASPVTSFSTNTTVSTAQRASTYVWTGGAGTLTLDTFTTLGNNWYMSVRNGGTGTLTVSPAGGGLINGASSIILQPSDSCVICCSGAAFYTIGLGQVSEFNFTQLTKAVTNGTYTLTSSEAANVIQKYTGTLTGNVTIELPQTIQVYYITNQTSGGGSGYTLTFTTGVAGGSNATVTAGQQVTLICDSANLLNANTIAAGASTLSLNSGAVGAPSLNFAAETSTGVYRPGSGQLGIAILGLSQFILDANGLTIQGSGTFIGGISGGTFP